MKIQSTQLGILMLTTIVTSSSVAIDSCDCTKWPYVPMPPCFEACFVKTASNTNSETLQRVLGLNEELASKISGLDDLSVSLSTFVRTWERSGLEGSSVELVNGTKVGRVVGYYQLSSSDQLYFAVDNTQTKSVVGIPVGGIISTASNSLELSPHTPVYNSVEQSSWTGETINIRQIPSWTPRQLNADELQILRKKMEEMSQSQFQELNQN